MTYSPRFLCLAALLAGPLSIAGFASTITAVPTSTLLSTNAAGYVTSKISHGTAVVLTVQVQSPSAPVTHGQVQFCDASAPHCTGLALLGTAQITPAGTATLKLIPGIGTHTYQAQFLGILDQLQPSSSSSQMLTVTGKFPTATTINISGSNGLYTLQSTVISTGSTLVPHGYTTFSDLDLPATPSQSLGNGVPLGPATFSLQLKLLTQLSTIGVPVPNVVADFNGDGNLDIVDGVVLFGNGNGTFTKGPTISAVPCSITADFNSDGFVDCAGIDQNGNLAIYTGKGDGTFNASVTTTLPPYAGSLAVADFNGDGIPDVASVTADSGKGSKLVLLYGRGDGTFLETLMALPSPSGSIVTGDFNGDHNADLAVVQDGGVYVLFGNGRGRFPTNVLLPVAEDPSQIVVGDFNNDGASDLATLSYEYNQSISVVLSNGQGGFNATQYFAAVNTIEGLAVTDIDRDGNADLVFSGQFPANGTGVGGELGALLGNGAGGFNTTYFLLNNRLFSSQSSSSILIGDFNNDGNPDIIAGTATLLDEPQQTEQATFSNVPLAPGPHAIEGYSFYPAPTGGPFAPSDSPVSEIQVPQ